jgi:hypothetical protein
MGQPPAYERAGTLKYLDVGRNKHEYAITRPALEVLTQERRDT